MLTCGNEGLHRLKAVEPLEFYTSGTTGRPKGVRRLGGLGEPLAGQSLRAQGFAAMLGMPVAGVTLVCGPVYHSAQWAFSQFPLDLGSALVLRHKFDAAETLELIERHKVTNVHLVPTQFVRLLRLGRTNQNLVRRFEPRAGAARRRSVPTGSQASHDPYWRGRGRTI